MTEEWCFACYGAGFIQVSNVNIVCPTCHGQGTLNKGEQQMSEEETTLSDTVATVTFGNEALNAVQQEIEKLKKELTESYDRITTVRGELTSVRNTVHEFFSDQFDSEDYEITVTRDEANDLLGNINADLLSQEFEGTVTVTFSFTVRAQDEDEARSIVEDAVSGLENQIDAGSDDSYSQDDISVDL